MIDDLRAILSQKNLDQKYQVIVFKGHKMIAHLAQELILNDIKYLKKEII